MFMTMWGGEGWIRRLEEISGVLLYPSLPYSPEKRSLTEPGASLAVRVPQQSACLCPHGAGVTGLPSHAQHSHSAGDLNSRPHVCVGSALTPAAISPSLDFIFLAEMRPLRGHEQASCGHDSNVLPHIPVARELPYILM